MFWRIFSLIFSAKRPPFDCFDTLWLLWKKISSDVCRNNIHWKWNFSNQAHAIMAHTRGAGVKRNGETISCVMVTALGSQYNGSNGNFSPSTFFCLFLCNREQSFDHLANGQITNYKGCLFFIAALNCESFHDSKVVHKTT